MAEVSQSDIGEVVANGSKDLELLQSDQVGQTGVGGTDRIEIQALEFGHAADDCQAGIGRSGMTESEPT